MKSAAGSRDAAVPSQQKTVFVQRNMDRRNRHCRHLVLAEGIMGTGIMAMELENWICDMANGDKEGLRQFYEETGPVCIQFYFLSFKGST